MRNCSCVTALATLLALGYNLVQNAPGRAMPGIAVRRADPVLSTVARTIVTVARAQVGDIYDPGYFDLRYPNGDVPRGRGACTDVVIRALRAAGYDLQRLIHDDMKRDFGAYPHKWGLRRTDKNIDHRRVPNQMTFFRRHGKVLPLMVSARTLSSWRPGDVVRWKLDNGLDHTGILSDRRDGAGKPLVIHNLAVCAEEDVLTAWKITGHFRYPVK